MKAIIFDIDGTLADVEHRKHHLPNWDRFFAEMHNDPLIHPIGWLADKLIHASLFEDADKNQPDFKVIVVTARPEQYKEATEKWLERNLRWYAYIDRIYMRTEDDFRRDSVVKAEILQKIMDDGYEPFLVVDDRPEVVEMWRSFGITTLQCATDEIKFKHDGKHFLDILVGPAGAGKSTYVAAHYKDSEIISSDKIREEQGWGHHPEDLMRTWNYVHGLLKVRLENQIKTVLDATNIDQKDRLRVLENVPKGQYVRYIVIDRPFNDKLADKGWRTEELLLKQDKIFRKNLKEILSGDNQPNVVIIDKRA